MTDLTRVLIGPPATDANRDAGATPTVTVPRAEQLRRVAESATTDLLWLLDAAAVPLDDALSPLLAAENAPAASLPVDALGAPVERLIGRFADEDDDAVVAAVAHAGYEAVAA